MPLSAAIQPHLGRPTLFINNTPTDEFWCYGDPVAIDDFTAAGIRICQFHVPFPSWWIGPDEYDFAPLESKIDAFLDKHPDLLLIPRVNFGYEGEAWWGKLHPDHLSEGRNLDDQPVDYLKARCRPVDCWASAASDQWTQDAGRAMQALVQHFEARDPDNILGYQVGSGISAEWFRWWTFVEEAYEDYSPIAVAGFRAFLRERYADDAALQAAWGRSDVNCDTAKVPAPTRLHQPERGFFRDPVTERDIVDWLDFLSQRNADQLIALCQAVKDASNQQKLAGTFYGYLWPHWNTQNPARSGHMACERVFKAPAVDYISAPYQYDNRQMFHHSETVPEAVMRCGKLFVDEIDSATHLTDVPQFPDDMMGKPKDAAAAVRILTRDAAAVLGTAGTAWWMDLRNTRWYADVDLQQLLQDVQQLTSQKQKWTMESQSEVAFVIDSASYGYADLRDNLNLYFTSLPRQFDWSALGFPSDTVLLSELADVKTYKLYVFLNCWHVTQAQRQVIFERTRRSGGTAVYFYGAGYYDESGGGPEQVSDLVGMQVDAQPDPAQPIIQLADTGHPLVEQSLVTPRGHTRFGATLSADRVARLMTINPRGWDQPVAPLFEVTDLSATVLGHYTHDHSPAIAVTEHDGWTSVYCGAPLLPDWFLRRLAESAGVHCYAPLGTQVYHCGPLLSLYHAAGADIHAVAPVGARLTQIEPQGDRRQWRPKAGFGPAYELDLRFASQETKFFVTNR
jgi:hypothetical protein